MYLVSKVNIKEDYTEIILYFIIYNYSIVNLSCINNIKIYMLYEALYITDY